MSGRIEAQDHVCGARDAPVEVVEYGDYQCPFTRRAHVALVHFDRRHPGRLRIAFRHRPLSHEHPFAALAAEAAEAAAAQGRFWEMHGVLFAHQDELAPALLDALAGEAGLDVQRFRIEMDAHLHRPRVMADLDRADNDGARGTPTFFINGERYRGDSDEASLAAAFDRALS